LFFSKSNLALNRNFKGVSGIASIPCSIFE
jgi:hypothetical protein